MWIDSIEKFNMDIERINGVPIYRTLFGFRSKECIESPSIGGLNQIYPDSSLSLINHFFGTFLLWFESSQEKENIIKL